MNNMIKYPRVPKLNRYKDCVVCIKMEHMIQKVFNEKKNEVIFNEIRIIKYSHKYSNTNTPSYRIIIDDQLIKKNDKLTATYKCPMCLEIVGPYRIQNITRRLNTGISDCYKCKEKSSKKRLNQSVFMVNNASDIVNKKYNKEQLSTKSCKDIIKESNDLFESLDVEKKDQYFQNHFKITDKLLSNIISVSNVNITKLTYFEHFLITKTKFFPRFYDNENDKIIKPENIVFKCITCNTETKSRQLSGVRENKSNLCNFKCKYCYLVSEKFSIKETTNIEKIKITYQSNLEYDFIIFCNSNKILIHDGPIIKYYWNGKNRKYKTDFYLPKFKIILELKGNHIWHKKQVDSGKWEAKEKCAINYCKENQKIYKLVFEKEMSNFKNYLIRYSPTSSES